MITLERKVSGEWINYNFKLGELPGGVRGRRGRGRRRPGFWKGSKPRGGFRSNRNGFKNNRDNNFQRGSRIRTYREGDTLKYIGEGPGLPRTVLDTLKYLDQLSVRTRATNSVLDFAYQVGLTAALIDTVTPGTGPVKGDFNVPNFLRYRPLKLGIKLIISNPEVSPITVVIVPQLGSGSTNSLAKSTIQALINERNAVVFMLDGANTAKCSRTFKKKWSIDKILGLNSNEWRSDPQYTGGVAGHPTTTFCVQVAAFNNEGTNWTVGVNICSQFRLEYELYEPIE